MAESVPLHGVVVLAAGASSRLGTPKQLLIDRGETLVRRAVRSALATQPAAAIVVVGAHADAVFAAVADLAVQRVDAVDWRAGMGASLRAGLAALPAAVDAALIVLCDQPALDAAHLIRLVALWRQQPEHAAATTYGDAIGVPALLPRRGFAELRQASVDSGARDWLARHRADVRAIRNDALAHDIDIDADRRALHEE